MSRLNRRLWGQLTTLRQRLVVGMDGALAGVGALELTVPQTMVLFRLVEQGPLTVTQIQAITGRSQAATSHLVTQLERHGLVERGDDPEDRRRTRVRPTKKAAELAREVERLRLQSFTRALAGVPEPLVRRLDEAVGEVLRAMEAKR